ncbi:MAG: hypothetical protein JNK00_01840 [Flavipsychrobacter sp.]|nr:hypothetical protein [Flavipsychrobacter sp.]
MRGIIIALFAACTLAACEKDNNTTNPTPTPTPSPAPTNVIDPAKLAAKWEATSNYNLRYNSAGTIIEGSGLSQTYTGNGVAWDNSFKTYITFNSNNTYTHSDASGSPGGKLLDFVMPTNGSWSLKSNNKVITLSLKGAGSQTVMQDFDVVEFKDTYLHISYTDTNYPNGEKMVYHYDFKK